MSDDGRTFDLNGSGARLVLYKNDQELAQGDFDRFFFAFENYLKSDMRAVDEGKKLRAAFDAHWIESLKFGEEVIQSSGEVSGIKPQWRVRWAAGCIEEVINRAREVPKASSSKPPTLPNAGD